MSNCNPGYLTSQSGSLGLSLQTIHSTINSMINVLGSGNTPGVPTRDNSQKAALLTARYNFLARAQAQNNNNAYWYVFGENDRSPQNIGFALCIDIASAYSSNAQAGTIYRAQCFFTVMSFQLSKAAINKKVVGSGAEALDGDHLTSSGCVAQVVAHAHANTDLPVGRMQSYPPSSEVRTSFQATQPGPFDAHNTALYAAY